MSELRSKGGAVLFALLMVTSMFVGFAALGGTAAAAAPQSPVTDNTATDTAVPGEITEVAALGFNTTGNVSNATVDVSAGNQAANITADDVSRVIVELQDPSGNTIAQQDATYSSLSTTVSFGGNQSNVQNVSVRAEVSSLADDNDILDANVSFSDAAGNSTATIDTNNNQTITAETGARLRGEVLFQNGNPATNVTIDILDTDTGNVAIPNVTTRGDDTASPGTWGPRVASPGNYTAVLDPLSPLQGQYEDFSTNVQLDSGETEKIETTLDENLVPADIEVVPENGEAVVGDQIEYTVTVYDQNGDALEGASVFVSGNSNNVVNVVNNNTKTTDANGQQTFSVDSSQIATSTLTWEAANLSGPNPSDTATATFIQRGEGVIRGDVNNGDAAWDEEMDIEGADVWAVSETRYNTNTFTNDANITSLVTDDDDTVWIRLVDNETDAILGHNEYDLNTGPSTHVRRVADLNQTENAVGQGFALIDEDGDDIINFSHTRLEPQEYYAQLSVDAWNASDETVRDDGQQENFINVTNATAGTIDELNTTNDPVVFSPTANLTPENAQELSAASGQRLYTQSQEDGDYQLTNLFTDFQTGENYNVFARDVGFLMESHFVNVTEENDGSGDWTVQQAFTLEETQVEPDGVDIQQIGTSTTLAGNVTEFDNQTDEFFQEVPRDGVTYDVMLVNSTAQGELVNATVDIHFNETFDLGDFEEVQSGQLLSADNGNNTATITTSDDGQAWVWFQTGETVAGDGETVSYDVEKWATLATDARVTDYSNARFIPVENFDSGSITGNVRNTDVGLPETVVWTREFDTAAGYFEIVPHDVETDIEDAGEVGGDEAVEDAMFQITYTTGDLPGGTVINTANVTAADLRNYDFAEFPSVSTPNVEDFNLLRFPQEDGSYSMDRVPAQDPLGVDYARLQAVQYGSGDTGNGTSSNPVRVGFTEEGDVVIPEAVVQAADLSIALSAPDTVTEGDNFTVTADITNNGGVSATTDVMYSLGTEVAMTEDDVEIAAGVTETVTFEVDTSGIPAGDYNHGVSVDGTDANTSITIESSGGSNWWDAYTNDSGVVDSSGQIFTAIDDFNNGDLTSGQMFDLIESFETGTPVQDLQS